MFVSVMAILENVKRLLHAQCPRHTRMEGAGIGQLPGPQWSVLPGSAGGNAFRIEGSSDSHRVRKKILIHMTVSPCLTVTAGDA